MPACWSGCVVVLNCVGSLWVVGHSCPRFRNRHVLPEKYGPTTSNLAGPDIGVPAAAQTSSSPNASRVGTPAAVWLVGSGAIHWLYQDWMPGQYCEAAHAVPFRAEPDEASATIAPSDSIRVHVCPKSEET